ncbi:MAG: hypothetical protein AB7Q81_11365 [Gammaproteobacteria bacterium]
MSGPLHSAAWYRVASLRPRLRAHTEVHRHRYRGELWYLVQDHITGRFHRLTPQTWAVLGLMDGAHSLAEIWDKACARLGDDLPTQDELIGLLGQLHRAEIVHAELPPDLVELGRRRARLDRQRLLARLRSPLSIRIPVWDPERFLERTRGIANLVYGPLGAITWLLLTAYALGLAALHWEALSGNLADRVLAVENLVLLWFVYPVVKLLHELGHAYAVKRWGGEVHEIGIMLLVFVPVPYVETSAAYAFPGKYQRALVDGAGILVEVFLAALAMIAWTALEPGAPRSVAFNVMLVAGVSTVLLNGNPLLRFDAYYALADLLEIPNLGQRANRQLGAVLARALLGVERPEPPARSRAEATWLVGYAVASFCYRVLVMLGIALFVASRFFFVGVLLAALALYGLLIQPALRLLHYLLLDARTRPRRARAVGVTVGTVMLVTTVVGMLPLPHATLAEGVLAVPDDARVVTRAAGHFGELLVEPGQRVAAGSTLLKLDNAELDARATIAAARVEELLARQDVLRAQRRTTDALLIADELEHAREALARAREAQAGLRVTSPVDGTFQLARAEVLAGRYLRRGETVGYVLDDTTRHARVLVRQDEVDAVRGDLHGLAVRCAEAVDTVVPARLVGEVPAADRTLPSLALATEGGGRFALDPAAHERPLSFNTFFQFEIALDATPLERLGERVYVRFEHTPEPLVWRWWRTARRTLLEHLAL